MGLTGAASSRRSGVVKNSALFRSFIAPSGVPLLGDATLLPQTTHLHRQVPRSFIYQSQRVDTKKPRLLMLQKTESLLSLLSSLYLSVICLCLNIDAQLFFFLRTLDNLISVQQQQHLRPLWPFLVSCCVAHHRGADVEPALHGRLEPQWPCVLTKLGLVGHMVSLRLLPLARRAKRSCRELRRSGSFQWSVRARVRARVSAGLKDNTLIWTP